MSAQHSRLSDDKWADYLISEFDALQRARDGLNSVASDRFNFFLAAASAVTVTLGFIANAYKLDAIFFLVAVGLLSILLFLGLLIFLWVTEAHVTLFTYIRGMNKIRRYFVEQALSHNPNVKDYFILPTRDNVPTFTTVGVVERHKLSGLVGLSAMMAVINSAIAGALCICVLELLAGANGSLSDAWAFALSGLLFIAFFAAHTLFYSGRMKRAEAEGASGTKFPTEIVSPPPSAAP